MGTKAVKILPLVLTIASITKALSSHASIPQTGAPNQVAPIRELRAHFVSPCHVLASTATDQPPAGDLELHLLDPKHFASTSRKTGVTKEISAVALAWSSATDSPPANNQWVLYKLDVCQGKFSGWKELNPLFRDRLRAFIDPDLASFRKQISEVYRRAHGTELPPNYNPANDDSDPAS